MKRIALLLAAGTAFAGPALAADIVYEEPVAPIVELAPQALWTGFYIGGQAGVAFNGDDNSGFGFNNDNNLFGGNDYFDGGDDGDDDAGFIGGAHVGYDYQVNNFLVGVVADINYIDADTSSTYTLGNSVTGFDTFGVEREINFLGTVRGKVGVTADRLAVYATGGLAYADTDTNFISPNAASLVATNGYSTDIDDDDSDVGYAIGAGVDYLVADNLSVGVEYLYTDLGSSDFDVNYTDVTGNTDLDFSTSSNNDIDFHTVWAKASFRFN